MKSKMFLDLEVLVILLQHPEVIFIGYVFEAIDATNKRKVAWKRIQKVGKKLSREYEILFEIKNHVNVVKLLDFFYSKTKSGKLI